MPNTAGNTTEAGPTHIDELRADRHNRRKHTARNIGMVVDALQAVGAARSIVIDEDDVVLAGNGVAEAAAQVGITSVRVIETNGDEIIAVRRRGLTPEQKRALAIYDNRAAELAEWDAEQFQADLDAGLTLQPWFTDKEQSGLFDRSAKRARTDTDFVPDKRTTSIAPGHLFQLGRHRLLCGDSTRREEVARVLDGRRADLVFTDPPYGVNVTGKGGDAIAGDISFTAIPLMFDVLSDVMAPGAWCYVCGGQSNAPLYSRLFERYFRQLPRIIVWDKGNTAVLRQNGYHSCFEFIYYTFVEGGGGRWFGPRDSEHADDIWRYRVEHGEERVHLTQKPVALPLRAITNTCPEGGLVFEPFGGSGSTLIAAEQADRPCVVVEQDEHYCQVIIDRWEKFTGAKALKVA